jgi:hypothetical protein
MSLTYEIFESVMNSIPKQNNSATAVRAVVQEGLATVVHGQSFHEEAVTHAFIGEYLMGVVGLHCVIQR